jgi:hypothetical protein
MRPQRFACPADVSLHRRDALSAIAAQRHIVDNTRRHNSRLAIDLVKQPLIECQASSPVWIFIPGNGDLPGKDMVRPEARGDRHGSLEAQSEQTRPSKQNKR